MSDPKNDSTKGTTPEKVIEAGAGLAIDTSNFFGSTMRAPARGARSGTTSRKQRELQQFEKSIKEMRREQEAIVQPDLDQIFEAVNMGGRVDPNSFMDAYKEAATKLMEITMASDPSELSGMDVKRAYDRMDEVKMVLAYSVGGFKGVNQMLTQQRDKFVQDGVSQEIDAALRDYRSGKKQFARANFSELIGDEFIQAKRSRAEKDAGDVPLTSDDTFEVYEAIMNSVLTSAVISASRSGVQTAEPESEDADMEESEESEEDVYRDFPILAKPQASPLPMLDEDEDNLPPIVESEDEDEDEDNLPPIVESEDENEIPPIVEEEDARFLQDTERAAMEAYGKGEVDSQTKNVALFALSGILNDSIVLEEGEPELLPVYQNALKAAIRDHHPVHLELEPLFDEDAQELGFRAGFAEVATMLKDTLYKVPKKAIVGGWRLSSRLLGWYSSEDDGMDGGDETMEKLRGRSKKARNAKLEYAKQIEEALKMANVYTQEIEKRKGEITEEERVHLAMETAGRVIFWSTSAVSITTLIHKAATSGNEAKEALEQAKKDRDVAQESAEQVEAELVAMEENLRKGDTIYSSSEKLAEFNKDAKASPHLLDEKMEELLEIAENNIKVVGGDKLRILEGLEDNQAEIGLAKLQLARFKRIKDYVLQWREAKLGGEDAQVFVDRAQAEARDEFGSGAGSILQILQRVIPKQKALVELTKNMKAELEKVVGNIREDPTIAGLERHLEKWGSLAARFGKTYLPRFSGLERFIRETNFQKYVDIAMGRNKDDTIFGQLFNGLEAAQTGVQAWILVSENLRALFNLSVFGLAVMNGDFLGIIATLTQLPGVKTVISALGNLVMSAINKMDELLFTRRGLPPRLAPAASFFGGFLTKTVGLAFKAYMGYYLIANLTALVFSSVYSLVIFLAIGFTAASVAFIYVWYSTGVSSPGKFFYYMARYYRKNPAALLSAAMVGYTLTQVLLYWAPNPFDAAPAPTPEQLQQRRRLELEQKGAEAIAEGDREKLARAVEQFKGPTGSEQAQSASGWFSFFGTSPEDAMSEARVDGEPSYEYGATDPMWPVFKDVLDIGMPSDRLVKSMGEWQDAQTLMSPEQAAASMGVDVLLQN